jgi:hypothetical protein
MGNLGALNTKVHADDTRAQIRDCFRKWGVKDFDIIRQQRNHNGHEGARIEYYANSQRQSMGCDRFWDYRTNLRALYLILNALRLAAERGILEELARAALAMLPEAKRKRPAWEVLGIQPDAPLDVAEAVYKALAKKHHPDAGGSDEAMKELNEAFEAFRSDANNGPA